MSTADDPLSDRSDDEFTGDEEGRNESEPVSAHVERALLVTDVPYPEPLERLLSLGPISMTHPREADVAVKKLDFTQAHVPALVRMARDRALNTAPRDDPRVWAPVYALYALTHLDAGAHVSELLLLFDVDDDWMPTIVGRVVAKTGERAIDALLGYIRDGSRWLYGRMMAIGALAQIPEFHDKLYDRVVLLLMVLLYEAEQHPDWLNASVISELLELRAVEALPAIRRAFELDRVDRTITGDWISVLEDFELELDPQDPMVIADLEEREMASIGGPTSDPWDPISAPGGPSKKAAAKKKKAKRKMAKASRKANKKKR